MSYKRIQYVQILHKFKLKEKGGYQETSNFTNSEKELEKYNKMQDKLLESDFDRVVKKLINKENKKS